MLYYIDFDSEWHISTLPLSKIKSQGLIDCLKLGMELLSMEVEGVEGVLIPVLGWVAIISVVVLLLGGVGLGIYIRSRYFNSNITIK